MTGSVFKVPEVLEDDEFVPARLMMTSCTADPEPVGLVCQYDKASDLEEDSWVTVEGTLFINQTYGEPDLVVTKITPAKEVEGYVYPY